MNKARILIISAAVVVRRLLAVALAEEGAFEVAGTASTGRGAVARLPGLTPDVVVLDLDTAEADCLKALVRACPRLPVVAFSRFLPRSAPTALEALALGAAAFVALERSGSLEGLAEAVGPLLVPRIKDVLKAGPRGSRLAPGTVDRPGSSIELPTRARVEVVAVGASTGGPDALAAFLSTFPADCPVPIVVVQHMPPVFTRLLSARLSSRCHLAVAEASDGIALRPGQVWIAPGNHHLVLARDGEQRRLHLHQGPAENSCRPSVDVLFRSVAEVCGAGALAVLLTGMGRDGLHGCERIRRARLGRSSPSAQGIPVGPSSTPVNKEDVKP
jgi:two-component system chemotaxis response regulator CheB